MAAFSFEYPPFLVDSVFLPNSSNAPVKSPGFLDEFFPNFNQFYQQQQQQQQQSLIHQEGSLSAHESSCVEQKSNNNELSMSEKQRTESFVSSMVDKAESGEQVTQNSVSGDKKRKCRNGSSSNSANSKDAKQVKCKKQKGEKQARKDVKNDKNDQNQGSEEPPKGYIHVRARRGQATDSHSLAERVRREKISERMKTLQALVPGCDKVTGKALMLDEIINYVQSLQNQVEFLSMKLASLDPMVYTFGLMDLEPMAYGIEGMHNNAALQMPLPPQSTTAPATTTTVAASVTALPSPVADNPASLLQHEQKPSFLPLQDGRSLYWGLDDQQRQSIINQFGFGANNLYSFQ